MIINAKQRSAAILIGATAPLLILTACSSNDGTAPSGSTTTAGATQQQTALAVSDQWIKASPADMTGMFGVLTNNSDSEIRVVSASTPVAGKVELHETVSTDGATSMREKKDGYAIPARGSLTLKPGGDHIMFMELKGPINAGQPVTVDLRLSDGSTQTVTAVARDFAGNQENYQP